MKLRKTHKILIGLGLVALALAATAFFGRKAYRTWRQDRLVVQARKFLQEGDTKKAVLAARRAVSLNSRDVEACRVMANIAEATRSPAALVWRHRVVELNPDSVDDRLALVRAAVAFRDFASATNALAAVPEKDQNTAEYQNVAGGVLSILGRVGEAATRFEQALKLDPENSFIALNLAIVRLQSTNSELKTGARASLLSLADNTTNSALRCLAMRELVKDALHGGQTNLAREMADRLVQEPDSTFGDDLLRLDVLGTSRSQEFSEALKAVRTAATNALHATNSLARLHELALWQISRLSPAESLSWARSLPEEVQTNTPIAMITADLLVAARDWTDLAEFLEKQHWAEADTLRLAYRALALRQQGLEAAAQAEWGQAIKGASGSKGGMLMLLRMAADWKWQNEVMEVLSSFVSRYPLEQWAVDLLTQAYLREGQTRPLLALFRQLQPTKPDDLSLKNNLAMTALLLDAQELRPHDLAREVFEAAKTNASFASTYAFSLHLQEKHAEALEIMRQLPANALEDPMIAGYYAMILKANGRSAEAERFFEISSQAKLLPEERRIIDQARGSGG